MPAVLACLAVNVDVLVRIAIPVLLISGFANDLGLVGLSLFQLVFQLLVELLLLLDALFQLLELVLFLKEQNATNTIMAASSRRFLLCFFLLVTMAFFPFLPLFLKSTT